jgi:hypothetical protein
MQIKHGRVGLATCGGSILGSAVVWLLVAPVIATIVVVISASLRFLLRRRSCVMKIQQSSGWSGLIFIVTDHDEDNLKERRKVEANREEGRQEKDAERDSNGRSWWMWWRRSKSINIGSSIVKLAALLVLSYTFG